MTKAERAKLVKANIDMAFRLSGHFASTHGRQVEAGDYVTAAYLALIEASERYEPGGTCSFEQFARYRIYGAMMDQLRKEVGKSDNRRRRMHYAKRSFHDIPMEHDGFGCVESEDWTERVASCVPDERARQVVRLKAEGFTHKEIGQRIGCVESRVSQLFRESVRPFVSASMEV